MNKKVFEYDFEGRKLVFEHGELARQASGSILVRYGDTAVLSAVVVAKEKSDNDYFPMQVQYSEKQYSVGKIPGGFIKREGRPTENATLAARLIDRPIRPLFKEGFYHELQIVNSILSVDQDNSPEISALLGTSLALAISPIPLIEPIAGVIVGRVNGKFIINPTLEQSQKSDLSLTMAGTLDAINMVEASCSEVLEEDILKAMVFGHKAIKKLINFQKTIIKEIGEPEMTFEAVKIDEELAAEVKKLFLPKLVEILKVKDKLKRYYALDDLKADIIKSYQEASLSDQTDIINQVKKIITEIEYQEVRKMIMEKNIRIDGRKMDEIRPLTSRIDILARTHGSALFVRGQTQALSITTLGALGEHQILDGLGVEEGKRFMHHYNFPPFSVGEVGRYGPPNRREIGHGALGEKALLQVLPSEEEFPYTIRVVSEVLESNGSSSQASICAASMSLMAAGVPIKAPLAGIAMGLISDGDRYKILTDIQGIEDHLGDMDFKVAGTRKGICAMQMDIKIKGLTKEILAEALEKARKGRLLILDNMEKAIKEPKAELSPYAPKIKQIQIKPVKIKEVIGRGGEMITKIIDECDNAKIDIEDDGRVIIYHNDYKIIDKVISMIEDIVKEVEDGKIYTGKVVKIESFGCFVELWPGCEGLVHISQIANKRINKVEDVLKEGDDIIVKAIGYDKKGRLNLSRKAALK